MAATSQITRQKMSLLKLAEELGKVSKVCQIMCYWTRSTKSDIRPMWAASLARREHTDPKPPSQPAYPRGRTEDQSTTL